MCNTPTADTDSIFLEVGLRGVFRGGGPLHTSCQVLSSFIQGRWESGSLWPESPSAQWRWQPNYLCHFQLRLKDITLWKECHLSSKLSVKYLWGFFFYYFWASQILQEINKAGSAFVVSEEIFRVWVDWPGMQTDHAGPCRLPPTPCETHFSWIPGGSDANFCLFPQHPLPSPATILCIMYYLLMYPSPPLTVRGLEHRPHIQLWIISSQTG